MALARPLPLEAEAAPGPRITWAEWRWLSIVSAVLLGLTIVPVLVAALRAPAGTIFTGYVVIARDAFVYQHLWRAGWEGAWLFHPAFTSESLPGVLLYPWYLWPGHLIGWLPAPWLYHGFRLLADAALLTALYLLISEVFRLVTLRRWAFVLAALGGGIGVLLPASIGPFPLRATEMVSPGTSVGDLVSMAPHLPAALALMCWVFVVALRCRTADPVRPALLVGGLAALLGLELIYPQLAILALFVVGGWATLRRTGRGLAFAALGALVCAPYAAYLVVVFRTSPDALKVVRASLDVGDPFGFLVLSHLSACALILLAIATRRLHADLALPALWIAGMTAFMFLPGLRDVVGRSFMASSIPFGICAAPGLLVLLRAARSARARRRLLGAALAVSSLFGLFSLAQPYWIAAFRLDAAAEYQNRGEAAILGWLSPQLSAHDIVLTDYLSGVFVPAETDARTFVGHPDQTLNAQTKANEAMAFFRRWTVEERADFLRRNGIDYVLTTTLVDRASLAADPQLVDVRDDGDASLFRVRW